MKNAYSQVIKQYGLTPYQSNTWISVGQTERIQGWKIHLSSTPDSSCQLLAKVLPLIKKQKLAFKVIKDVHLLELLNSGDLGLPQCGKFITIYPTTDRKAVDLAKKLLFLTQEFCGPAIPSDLHLGGIVYTRYGAFNPVIKKNRFGEEEYYIQGEKNLLEDDTRTVPFKNPDNVTNPFKNLLPVNHDEIDGTQNKSKAIGPGYLLLDVVKNHAKGAIYTGIDLRNQESVNVKIVKQGRHDYLADRHKRDIRDRLKKQEKLHMLLAGEIPIPKADPYFEYCDNGYLPLEYIEGENLENFVKTHSRNQPWFGLEITTQKILLTILVKLINALIKLHNKGYIHRDLTITNVLINKDNEVYILDLELAHRLNDHTTPPFSLGTPGFMSPQQEAEHEPAFTDDIYSLGCIILYILAGIEPGRFVFLNDADLRSRLNYFGSGLHKDFIQIISRCISNDPAHRPGLEEILQSTENSIRILSSKKDNALKHKPPPFLTKKQLREVIRQGLSGILHATAQNENGLWQSPSLNNMHQGHFLNGETKLELRRSANRGIAGVVYLLSRLSRYGNLSTTNQLKSRAINALEWLFSGSISSDTGLPGLHFGEAGVTVAVAQSIHAGILSKSDENIKKVLGDFILSKIDWHDVTHGAAGQGLAAYCCADILQDKNLYILAERCAKYIIQTQNQDGSWQVPKGVRSIEGKTFTGFAHGVAGIIYFLAEHVYRTGNNDSKSALQKGIDWLLKISEINEKENSIQWPYSLDSPTKDWKWWCHGSPGIALSFLRLYELYKIPLYKDTAIRCLNTHLPKIQCVNLSQCHGLSGIGEIYLEAYRVLREEEWKERAQHIALTLYNLRKEEKRGWVWPVQDTKNITADLMTGCAGIVHFFLRLLLEGREIGMPLLLNPVNK